MSDTFQCPHCQQLLPESERHIHRPRKEAPVPSSWCKTCIGNAMRETAPEMRQK